MGHYPDLARKENQKIVPELFAKSAQKSDSEDPWNAWKGMSEARA